MTDRNIYPAGWDKHRIQQVLDHYEDQSDEEAALEDDTSLIANDETVMVIPKDLVPAVRALISRQ